MHSRRVWVLAHAELGTAVFHLVFRFPVPLDSRRIVVRRILLGNPPRMSYHHDLDVTPTVGGYVNSNVHSQQEAPP